MKYRKLGNTGFDISEIGFGTWQLGGERWLKQSDAACQKLLLEANDLGVNIFDVAAIYGQYEDQQGYLQSRSQELLGQAFASRRNRVFYCLKLGQFDEISHRHDYQPKRVIEQFKHALRRLQTDYIDICLIHAPSIHEVKCQRAITILQTLQAQGLVRHIGYSFEAEPEHVLHAIQQQIDVIMLQYNCLDQQCRHAIELARLHGIGILVGGPFKRGYLTGEFKTIDELPQDDHYWRWNIQYNSDKVKDTLSSVNHLLAEHGTPEHLRAHALGFILNEPGVASCVVGHRHLSEVIENIKATAHLPTPTFVLSASTVSPTEEEREIA